MKAISIVALLVSLLMMTSQAYSDDKASEVPALGNLVGKYKYAGDRATDEARISEEIKSSTEQMGSFLKKQAVKRLEQLNGIPEKLAISHSGNDITLALGDFVVTAPADGTKIDTKTPFGQSAKVWFDVKQAKLIQEVVQTTGRRENTFRYDPNGQLVMHTSETNPKLSKPVAFSLKFERTSRE